MRKDEMTNGRAKWIKCPEFGHVEIPPLHWGGGQAEQHQPISDEGGLCMFCKTFTVSGRASASVDATSLGVLKTRKKESTMKKQKALSEINSVP